MADLLNLTKEESKQVLNLRKDKIKSLNLSKPALQNHKARVGLVLDYSGSMNRLYRNGTVQAIIDRVLPIALEFDDNGEMDVWLFDDGYRRMPTITEHNYYGYVKNEISGHMGGTNYAPVMKDVMGKYLTEEPQSIPNYVIFITDGANFDKRETTATITEAANYPIFWQFIGIGGESFPYLEKLDDLKNRYVDNADFFTVSNVSDFYERDEIYNFLLNEYPGWLENSKVKTMVSSNYTRGSQKETQKKKLFGLF